MGCRASIRDGDPAPAYLAVVLTREAAAHWALAVKANVLGESPIRGGVVLPIAMSTFDL